MATILPLKKSDVNLLKDKAIELNVRTSYLEKDYYIVHLIRCLSELDLLEGKLLFAGGTALAKAYKLISRFSEDCDFIYLTQNSSLGKRKEFKERIREGLEQYGFNIVFDKSSNSRKNIDFHLQYECLSSDLNGLRPELKLEIIVKDNIIFPSQNKEVSSFLSEIKGQGSDVKKADCLSIEEIAVGKFSALTWRLLDKNKEIDPTRIRHLYDLAALSEKLENSALFKEKVKSVTEEDLIKRLKTPISFVEATQALLNQLTHDPLYRKMYENYVLNFIYSSEDHSNVSYEEALSAFANLALSISPPLKKH